MKLFAALFAFVRKVLVVAHDWGLERRIESVQRCPPYQSRCQHHRAQSLGKDTNLIADGGAVIFDSQVICEYLQSGCPLRGFSSRPDSRPGRPSLADGLLDAALLDGSDGARQPETVDVAAALVDKVSSALDRSRSTLAALGNALTSARFRSAALCRHLTSAMAMSTGAASARPSRLGTEGCERPSFKATDFNRAAGQRKSLLTPDA